MERTWDDVRAEAVEDFGDIATDGCKFETFYLDWLEKNCRAPELKNPAELNPFTLVCSQTIPVAIKHQLPDYFEAINAKDDVKYTFKPITETKWRQILNLIDKKIVKSLQKGTEEPTNSVK